MPLLVGAVVRVVLFDVRQDFSHGGQSVWSVVDGHTYQGGITVRRLNVGVLGIHRRRRLDDLIGDVSDVASR